MKKAPENGGFCYSKYVFCVFLDKCLSKSYNTSAITIFHRNRNYSKGFDNMRLKKLGLLTAVIISSAVLLCSCGKQEDVNGGDNADNPTIGNQNAVSIAISEENFPDSDFRTYISGNFDSNGDGSLDDSEIAKIKRIDVGNTGGYHYEISSLEGIKYFTELEYLDCGGNLLTELDVSGMANLEELSAYSNQLTSLNISGCAELEEIHVQNNGLTALDVSGCPKLEKLVCEVNKLTSLDVSACHELELLYCTNNQLPSLDVSGCAELELFVCIGNVLTELDVSSCPKLVRLACDDNKLTSLDLSGCPGLEELTCEYNEITELDVSKCPKLDADTFYCDESVNVIR